MALDNKSGSVWAVAIFFSVLTWLTVSLRIYVRAEQLAKFGLDDKLVIVAQIFFTGYLICQMGGAVYGTGRHLADLTERNAETALRFWFFCEIWYALAMTAVKVAICLSLRRVTVKVVHVVIVYALIIWSIALGLAFLLGIIFQCTPTSDWWSLDPTVKHHCIDAHIVTSLTYTVSALNVACDWTLGIFPFFIVKDLSIPITHKIMVASILAFGAVASTATLVRMFYVETLEQTYLGRDGEFLYDTTPVAVWSTVEVGVGISAICLATLRPLVTKAIYMIKPSSQSSYRHGYPRSSRLEDDPQPIPLTSPENGLPVVHPNSTYHPWDQHSGVTRFNGTKPLDSSHAEADNYHGKHDTHYGKQSPPLDNYNVDQFNTTKALSSSYGDAEEDFYRPGPAFRRHGPS